MIGQTPERVKRQMENSATFTNRDTLRAEGGPCKGEYWGLPWPCWTTTHCGTPLLYDSSKPVSDGGHDFRAKWGTAVPENKYNKHVGESLLRGDNPVAQSKYAYDMTGAAIDEYLAAGNPPTGRGKARIWAWDLPDPVPIHREPIESPRPDLIDRHPTYEDVKFQYRVFTPFKTNQQARKHLVDRYPIILSTGRQVEHMGGGANTRSCPYLVELQPEMYVEINPALAADIGVKHWDTVWVETLRGRCKVRAYVTDRVPYDAKRKMVFMPYHWAGIFEGKPYEDRYPEGTAEMALGDSVNIICADAYGRETQMQETKAALCKVYRA
jgi:formate dehydrogenase major subunit